MKKLQRVFIILFAMFICLNCCRAGYQSLTSGETTVAIAMFVIGVLAVYVPITIIKYKNN